MNKTIVEVHSGMAKFLCVVKFIKLVLYLSNVAFHAWIGSIFVVLFIIKPRYICGSFQMDALFMDILS